MTYSVTIANPRLGVAVEAAGPRRAKFRALNFRDPWKLEKSATDRADACSPADSGGVFVNESTQQAGLGVILALD